MADRNIYSEDLPGEVWVDAYGFDGYYEVSNKGRLRSIAREVPTKGGTRWIKGRTLSPCISNKGVRIGGMSVDGVHTTRPMAQLVYYSFHNGPPANGNVVAHKNKVLTDDRLENLEALSISQSNTLNYALGCSVYNGVGHIMIERANVLDKELGKTDHHQTCIRCLVERPIGHFQKKRNNRTERICSECARKARGIVAINKIRNAKELASAGLRKCSKCDIVMPFDSFHKKANLMCGIDTVCKQCSLAAGRIYDAARRLRRRQSKESS
jgi:hypothetical protein